MTNSSLSTSRNPLSRLTSGLLKVVDEEWLDFAVGHVNPLFSVSRTKASVVSIRAETADAATFEFQPNGNWGGFVPGQFVPVRVVIDGRMHERCYSLTSVPGADTLSITVKRQPNGLVSNWLHDNLKVGDVIELGRVAGEFMLPEPTPAQMLFLAGGSGITPVFSLIRAALMQNPAADIVLVYYARGYQDLILGETLSGLAQTHAGFRIQLVLSCEHVLPEDQQGYFSAEQLLAACPDYAQRQAFLCGPGGMIKAVIGHYEEQGLDAQLTKEFFGLPPVVKTGASAEVSYAKAGITVETTAATLLVAAEEAGLKPAFGCRMGVCNSCSCIKKEGVVRNMLTGEVNDTPNTQIRICISEPLSAVTLDI